MSLFFGHIQQDSIVVSNISAIINCSSSLSGLCADQIYLELNYSDVYFENYGGIQEIEVVCNKTWEAEGDELWIIITDGSGSGNGSFTIEVGETLSYREGLITVTSGDLTEYINVYQNS